MDVINTCPLGAKCEEIKRGKMHRCRAYIKISGTDPQGKQVDEFRCSLLEWQPILLLEIASIMRGNQAAVESFRNETVKGQNNFLHLAQAAMQKRLTND